MTISIVETDSTEADGTRHYDIRRSDAHVLTLKHDPRKGIPDLLRSAATAFVEYNREQKALFNMRSMNERIEETKRAEQRRAERRAEDRRRKLLNSRPRTWHLNLPPPKKVPGKWTPPERKAVTEQPPPPAPEMEPEPEETEARHPLSLRQPEVQSRSLLAAQARSFRESGFRYSEIAELIGVQSEEDVRKLISEAKLLPEANAAGMENQP